MDIHLVSTLTADDEDRVAAALLGALAQLLDALPIAYALQVVTSGTKVLQKTNLEPPDRVEPSAPASILQ